MIRTNLPAILGGTPVRKTGIPYGRQYIDEDDIKAVSIENKSVDIKSETD